MTLADRMALFMTMVRKAGTIIQITQAASNNCNKYIRKKKDRCERVKDS